ncbi:1-phosphatidylinositol phosphodiesterase, partial [Tolypocladium ophioglossoides CBS 100239]
VFGERIGQTCSTQSRASCYITSLYGVTTHDPSRPVHCGSNRQSELVFKMVRLIGLCALLSLHPIAALAGSSLEDLALQKTLGDASPVFGVYQDVQSRTSTWMRAYPDDTPIAHMNIPGTHDTATWNYSRATQQYLDHVTSLVGLHDTDPTLYRCQQSSIVDMLNAGIRVFDLRYAFDVTNSTLVFWHGPALQSETATLDDVLIGYYKWLDDHPSEAVFLSFQYQGSTAPNAQNDAGVQTLLYSALTSPPSKEYVLQTKDHIGTLGEARGKVTLLKRFDLNKLDPSYDASLPGVHFSPNDWDDNVSFVESLGALQVADMPQGPNITLVYNKDTGETAYIEDYYQPMTPQGSSLEENIIWKYNATVAHLQMAAQTHPDSLFWSFASSNNIGNTPPNTPEEQALGDGTVTGVNQRLIPFLKTQRGKRLGIVMFDFFEEPSDLMSTFLSLLPPKCAKKARSS